MTPADLPSIPTYAPNSIITQQPTSLPPAPAHPITVDQKFDQIREEINNQRLCNAQFDARIVTLETRTINIDSKIDILLDQYDVSFLSTHKIQRTTPTHKIITNPS
jgi:hypothetical protein